MAINTTKLLAAAVLSVALFGTAVGWTAISERVPDAARDDAAKIASDLKALLDQELKGLLSDQRDFEEERTKKTIKLRLAIAQAEDSMKSAETTFEKEEMKALHDAQAA